MSDLLNHLKGYSATVKMWNKTTFKDSLYAFPKKGFAPYNQVQKLRLGQAITPFTTVKEMQKPEEPIKIVKPKPEAKKEEAKKEEVKAKPEAKKSEKKSKPKTQIVKEKAEKKEKAVKQAIQAIIKEDKEEDAVPKLVIKEDEEDLNKAGDLDLEKIVARMEALEKMAETSGYAKSEDGKKIHDEYLQLQAKIQGFRMSHEISALKKQNADLARRVAKRVSSDEIQGIWALRHHNEQQIQAYTDFLKEQIANDSGLSIKGIHGSLTKAEMKELDANEAQMKEKVKGLKTKEDVTAFKKEQDKLMKAFKSKVSARIMADHIKETSLKKMSDEAKGIEEKPVKVSEGVSMGWEDIQAFANKKKAPKEAVNEMVQNVSKAVDFVDKPDWRAEAGYKDTVWNGSFPTDEFNRNSQLPKEYKPDDGWDWLASKYGKLYDIAVEKSKQVVRKGRPSWTDKEFKDFIRLPFDNTTQMKEFFRDILLADPILYNHLHINAHSTKAPATTNGLREFKKWYESK